LAAKHLTGYSIPTREAGAEAEMNENQRWNAGDVIVFRGVGQKGIWYVLPVFVVQDTPSLLALYWPSGTCGKWRMKSKEERVTPRDVMLTPMKLIDRTWDTTDVLMLITPGASHAVYVMWEEGQKNLLCWYINLQDPIVRTPIGFDTRDLVLDIVFSPDKAGWQWKDEDQLAEAVSLGLFSDEEGRMVRAEGERVIKLVCENQPPFCDGWEKWTPPTAWDRPDLPSNWDMGFTNGL
jgi:hypothetical protein